MKILFLGIAYRLAGTTDKIGGGEISNRTLLEELAKENEVYVFSAYGSGLWNEKVNNVTVYDLSRRLKRLGSPATTVSKSLYRLAFYFKAIKIKPDIILCDPNTVALAVFLSKKTEVYTGCFIRAFENFDTKVGSVYLKPKNLIKRFMYGNTKKSTINKMDFLLPNSDFMLEECKKEFDCDNYHVVYPPIDIKKHTLQIPDKIKEIVMVSNSEHKGFDIFKSLSEVFLDINFTAVGVSGIDTLEKVSDNLFLKGWQKNPKDFILSADLVLVPSKWEEPFGRIAVEALRYGRMVLVSDRGGLPETVNYSNSLILASDKLESWISKIKTMQTSPKKFEKEYNEAIVNSDKFSLDYQVKALNIFLEKFL